MKFIRHGGTFYNIANIDKIECVINHDKTYLYIFTDNTGFYIKLSKYRLDCQAFMDSFSHFLDSDRAVFDVEKELKNGFYLEKEG